MPEQLQFDYDVFISYSNHDRTWVRGELLRRIEKVGLRAFVDFRDFRPGVPSIKEMERGVTSCRATLLVLTPDYIDSAWCEIENVMLQTLDPANRNLRLIPLLKMECKKPLRIGALTHIDFTVDADMDLAWHRLLTSLSAPPEQPSNSAVPSEIQAELDSAKTFADADRYSEAIPILEKAMGAADASGHPAARVKVRLRLAWAIYEAHEDYTAAERLLRDALVLVPVENLDLKHGVLHALGEMLEFSGRLDEARATIDVTLVVAKRSGKTDDLAVSLISLGLLERALGLHESAVTRLDEALRLILQGGLSLAADQKLDHAHLLAVCYINKAFLCRDAGDPDEALALYQRVLKQPDVTGLDTGRALLFSGEVHCANADWEKGLDCFGGALECFKHVSNPLWGARALEHIALLYATLEQWDEAWVAIFGAVAGAEESGHPGEQIHLLSAAAELGREWKIKKARESAARQLHTFAKAAPEEEQAAAFSNLSAKIGEVHDAIEKRVRDDKELRDLLNQAKEIAQRERLSEHMANCLLHEARNMIPPEDAEARRGLIAKAVELLKDELQKSQFPKRRGRLMGQLSDLYARLGEQHQAASWLKKAGEVFEKSGDAFGLANYYGALAEMHRREGRLDDEIAGYRRVLSIIEGRSFYHLAAGTRINLAATLRHRGGFDEAQKLLNEAEALCDKHHFKEFISAIARIRSDLEKEVQAAQAPTHTLEELLASLRELLEYRPEYAVAYLPFWYFAWNTELLALLRSGPRLSFMVVTDDVERFMKFAAQFRQLADHFLMASSGEPEIGAEPAIIPMPPDWKFPATFPFLFMKRQTAASEQTERNAQAAEDDGPPNVRLAGPAMMFPLYVPSNEKSGVEGEGHMMALSPPRLPQEAIDLMIRRPIEELIERRAVWFPTARFRKEDRFLTDLRIGRERGVFPVYFDGPPASDAVASCGGVEVVVPNKLLSGDQSSVASKWRRALLKLTKLSKDEAQTALLDLPEVFAATDGEEAGIRIEIRLFEFKDLGRQVFHSVLLVRE
ncbi:MAG TPA: toll/interleukin-1 receptor domain-containing protein [Terriglobales bacterium]|nr:toll/interleukin-1 receptor domain-containing protein [Terriglobales bacterium]